MPIILAFYLPAPVWADPSDSVTHAMQWEEGQTIHIANQGGAINRHRNIKLSVELSSPDKVLVTESGARSEHNLYRDYSSDDSTKWLNVWQGTWSLAGDVMRLSLTLKDRKCMHQKKWSDAAPEALQCGTVSKHLGLSCTLSQVTPEGASGPTSAGATIAVWSCSLSATAELADLPSHWVLGKASCIKVLAGHRGFTYQRCSGP